MSETEMKMLDKKKEELLQNGAEEILEASFDGIMVTDGEGNCIFANRRT